MLLLMETSTASTILLSSSWWKETTTTSSRQLHTRRMEPHHLLHQQTRSQSRNPRATYRSNLLRKHVLWMVPPYLSEFFKNKTKKKKKKNRKRVQTLSCCWNSYQTLFTNFQLVSLFEKLLMSLKQKQKQKNEWSNVIFFFFFENYMLCDNNQL